MTYPELSKPQREALKRARLELSTAQEMVPGYTELWQELNDVIAEIERLLGF